MISSSCGQIDIVEALIQSGANVNMTDEFGYTELDYAEQAKQDTTRVFLSQHYGLRSIELGVRYESPEEFLQKTEDDISTEKNISNLQSSCSSRRQTKFKYFINQEIS